MDLTRVFLLKENGSWLEILTADPIHSLCNLLVLNFILWRIWQGVFAASRQLLSSGGKSGGSLSPFFETPVLSKDPSMDRRSLIVSVGGEIIFWF